MNRFNVFKLLIFTFLFLSCQNDIATLSSSENENLNEKYSVSVDEVINIANNLNLSGTQTKSVQKKVNEIKNVKRGGNTPFFYIATYENGGFSIIAGDKRVSPVLGFSENTEFPFDETLYPEGLSMWMDNVVNAISSVRRNSIIADEFILGKWNNKLQTKGVNPPGGNAPNCVTEGTFYDYERVRYEPLLSTTWEQRNGYNALLDNIGCESPPPVGCVPLATAQVMKYYARPTTINWASMPNGVASTTTAQLLKDLGGYLNVSYHCNGTGGFASDIPNVLKQYYGYSYAVNKSYNEDLIRNEIQNGHPVIFGAYDYGHIPNAVGHSWVCDGMEISYDYICVNHNTNYIIEKEIGRTHFHMNWGWNGRYNGFYEYPYFNVADYKFNSVSDLIIIHP